eukprot:gene2547-3299_t
MEEVARLSRLPYLEALWLEGNPLALALPSYRAAVLSNFKDPRSMLLDGRRCGATTLANAIRLAARNQRAMAGCTIAGYDTEEEEDRTEAGHRAIEGPEEESELDTTSEDSDSDQSEMGRQERCRAPTSPAMSAVSTTSVARARAQDGKEARMEGSRGNACDAAPSARGAESLDTPPLDIGAESPGTPPLDIPRPRGDSRGDFSLEPLCEAGHGAGGSLPEAREHRHRRRNSAHRSIDFDQCSEGEEEVSSRSYVEEASRPLDGTHLRAEATEGRQRVEAGVEGFFKGPSVVGADPGEARRERASGMAGARGQQWGTWDGAVRWRAAVRSSAIPSLRHKYTDLTPIPLAELPEPAPAQQQQHSAEGAATSATPLPPRHDSSVHCRAATDFPGGTASALASPDGGQTASSPDQAATSMQLPESGTVGAGSPPKGEDTARGALPSGSLGAQGFASGHGYDVSVGEPRGRDGRGYAEVQSPRSPVIKRDSALGLPEGMWEEMQARGAARGGAGSPVPGARVAVTMRSGDAAGGSAAVSREDHVAEGEGEPVAMGEDMGTVKAVEPGAGDICARTSSAGGTEAEEAAGAVGEGAITPSRWELTGERLRRQVDVLQREGGRSWLGIWDDFLQGEEHSRRAPSTSFVTPAATGMCGWELDQRPGQAMDARFEGARKASQAACEGEQRVVLLLSEVAIYICCFATLDVLCMLKLLDIEDVM